MGDTGSLAIGASLAAMGILSKQELVLLVFMAMFLVEIGSVILQVLYFKATQGKRIFKMSPLHHHFELSGDGGDAGGRPLLDRRRPRPGPGPAAVLLRLGPAAGAVNPSELASQLTSPSGRGW